MASDPLPNCSDTPRASPLSGRLWVSTVGFGIHTAPIGILQPFQIDPQFLHKQQRMIGIASVDTGLQFLDQAADDTHAVTILGGLLLFPRLFVFRPIIKNLGTCLFHMFSPDLIIAGQFQRFLPNFSHVIRDRSIIALRLGHESLKSMHIISMPTFR